jgi:large subunit ribosomal protein L21
MEDKRTKDKKSSCELRAITPISSPLNQRNFMAYAIVQTGGKQYRVAEGDVIDVEKLEVEAGSETNLDVLLVSSGTDLQVGTPMLTGATVTAEVVDQHKGDKVIAFKYKRRKGYHRTVGHRRQLTRLKIKTISA